MTHYPECPHCDEKHTETDWLYENGGYGEDGHVASVKCQSCKEPFVFKVHMTQIYESAPTKEDL